MSTRRLQGLALILSAICMIIGQFGNGSTFFHVIAVIGVILFILGIPAVYAAQSLGPLGLIGIILVELAAIIAVGFQTNVLTIAGIGGTLFWVSAVGGLIGAVIIGWLTVQKNVFPAWVGWAFLAQGVLNFLGGIINMGAAGWTYAFVVLIVGAAASFGYGYFLFQML